MRLEQSFDVAAPLETVWTALTDVQRVAPCLPGAEITEAGDDGSYAGTFKVKLGPTTAEYRGSLKLESRDDAAHSVTMRADGQDKRGQGGAKATIVSSLREEDGGTRVDVNTDFSITGRLARFGRGGMVQDVSNRLLREFAACLQEELGGQGGPPPQEPEPATQTPSPPPLPREPLDAGNLVGEVVRDRARDAAPFVLVALVLGFLLGRAGR